MATKIQIKAATPGFPRQLKWNDYKWVDQSPIPPFEALTGSSYKVTQWGYTLGTAPNGRRGSYFVDPLKITVSFIADSSWAVPSARNNPRLLAHEQGHFDITGLIARDFARRVLDLRVYGPEMFNANDPDEGVSRLDKKVKRISQRMGALWDFLQKGVDCLYDSDTEHGNDQQAQRDWSALLNHIKHFNLGFEETLVARGFLRIVSDPPDGLPTYS